MGILPKFILNRIYPPSEREKDIDIDIRSSGDPITFLLNGEIPDLHIYFKITNKSPYLDLNIDRIVFDMQLKSERGHTSLLHGTFLDKPQIKRKESKNVMAEVELKSSQIKKLEEVKQEQDPPYATIYVKAYFDSNLGQIKKETHLKNNACKIE